MTGDVSSNRQTKVRGTLPLHMEGRFRPWAIETGHSELLLRGLIGDPEDLEPPRVFDVLFKDVYRICLADRYDGIAIRVASNSEKASEERRVGACWQYSTMYLIKCGMATDYVVAGRVYWAEIGGYPGDSSPFLSAVAAKTPSKIFYFE